MSYLANKITGVKKIAVLRANALGDFIFAQPALHALRSAYPEAEIVYLGQAWHAAYLQGRPGPIDRVVVVPPSQGISRPETWDSSSIEAQEAQAQFFAKIQAEAFDLALQMHGGGRFSNPFLHQLGARVTAGMRAPGAPPLDRWMPYHYWQHEILRLLEVVHLVGAEPVAFEPRIAVTNQDLEEVCDAFPDSGKAYVVLHPGASDPRRRWPVERFARLGDRLVQSGYQVVLVGTTDEQHVVADVITQMREPAANLCGRLSLSALTGLLARAALLVGNDSGPRHLCEAVGTPTVGIFWCGNLINAGPLSRSHHRVHLSWRLECAVCGSNTLRQPCNHRPSFVDEVTLEEVTSSALDLLKGRG